MAKKKETPKSIALFGNEEEEVKIVKKKSSKTTKSSSKSDIKTKKEKPSSKKKSSIKEKETKKNESTNKSTKPVSNKNSVGKSADVKKSRTRSSSASTIVSSDKTDKTKKVNRVSSRTSQRGLQDSGEKSKRTTKRDKQVVSTTTKSTGRSKQSTDNGPKATRDVNKEDRRNCTRSSSKDSSVPVKDKVSRREEQEDGSYISKLRAEAKKIRKAGKYEITERISGPQEIEWGPKAVKDDYSIVEIIVGGKMKYVSPWSIKDKSYYEGLDSEFIVNCLKFKSDEEDNDLNELNNSLGTKYKTWEKASAHKKLPEALVMKYGSKMDWSILLKNNDINKYSKKLKKKFSAELSSVVALN